jgi:uncharacterized protein (DUF1330 family)
MASGRPTPENQGEGAMKEVIMQWYAVGILRDVRMGPPIREYLEQIDATLAPFGGHFVVHGGEMEMLEGENPGTLIVIEFPDHERARQWYSSPAYRKILPLRTENSVGTVFLAEGVDRTHRATDVLGG